MSDSSLSFKHPNTDEAKYLHTGVEKLQIKAWSSVFMHLYDGFQMLQASTAEELFHIVLFVILDVLIC